MMSEQDQILTSNSSSTSSPAAHLQPNSQSGTDLYFLIIAFPSSRQAGDFCFIVLARNRKICDLAGDIVHKTNLFPKAIV